MAEVKGELILWPQNRPDHHTMGGKAAALAQLGTAFPIPGWFVITPQAFLASLTARQLAQLEREEAPDGLSVQCRLATAIMQAVDQLDANPLARFAVRSSATVEDGAAASFAGQLQSFLSVGRAEIIDKVQAVWQSAFASHVQRYHQLTLGDPTLTLPTLGRERDRSQLWRSLPAVIVQRMVEATVAGVAFSADPVTGDRSRCTLVAGLGVADKLVAGEVNGDTYATDRAGTVYSQTLSGPSTLLDPTTIRAIVAMVCAVESHFGAPQDIEWAMEAGQLYLLQARPITTLLTPPSTGGALTIWDNSNIVESYSGVTSPLTFSFARRVYEHVYVEFCTLMGVPAHKIERERNALRNMLGFVNGHVYYNLLHWYRVLALFPGFKMNRRFMEQMMGVKQPLPEALLEEIAPQVTSRWERIVDALHLARTGLGLIRSQITLRGAIQRFYVRLNEALALPVESLSFLSLEELAQAYTTVEGKLLKQWDAPLVNDFLCMLAFGLARKLLERYGGEAGLRLHNEIMIGQGDIISAEPARRIQQMAVIAAQDTVLIETLLHGDVAKATAALAVFPSLQQHYTAYLTKFGNRCLQELKLESPTLHDDPLPLLRAIGQMARRATQMTVTGANMVCEPNTSSPVTASGISEDLHTQLAALLPRQPLKRWLVTRLVQWAKARVRDRENLRFERTRVFGYARQIFLTMGQRLYERNLIDAPRDIFCLEVGEVLALVEGALTTYHLRGLVALRKAQQARFAALPAPPNRFITQGNAFLAFQQGIEQPTFSPEVVDNSASRKGIGCCSGVVCAPVRVIEDPRTATLAPGEILVARFTDPGWITLFANAAGILVERGSLLSHSAIVARELGIPAIVAIDGIMAWLKNGDRVEMDGATGVVRKVL